MEGKNTVIPAFICGLASPLVLLFSMYYIENGDKVSVMFLSILIGLASGIVAIMLSLNAKKTYGKSGMGTAAFVLGIIGTSLCGLYLIVNLNSLDNIL